MKVQLIQCSLAITVFLYFVKSYQDVFCPDLCEQCFKDEVICTNSGRISLPEKISSAVEKLSLADQTFLSTTLTSKNFSQFEPPHISLKQLSIRHCNIKKIESRTFSALTKLESLDLSDNINLTIASNSFNGLKIRHLIIDNIDHLIFEKNVFQGLDVTSLSLSNCGIKFIDYDTLHPLSKSLSKLFLNKNHLRTLESKLVLIFQPLLALNLSDNQLHCDCNIQWLIKFYKSRVKTVKFNNVEFNGIISSVPKCQSPNYLERKFLTQINDEEIVCELAKIHELDIKFSSMTNGRIVCSGKQHSFQAPMQISWYNNSDTKLQIESETFINQLKSEKSVQIKYLKDIGHYRCVVNNSVGESSATVRVNWPNIAQNVANMNDYDEQLLESHVVNTKTKMWKSIFFEQRFTLLEIIAAVTGTILFTGIMFIIFHKCMMIKCMFVKKTNIDSSSRQSNLATLSLTTSYEPAVYSNSQTYDLPSIGCGSSNPYLPIPPSSSQHFLDFKTQRKIYRKL